MITRRLQPLLEARLEQVRRGVEAIPLPTLMERLWGRAWAGS